MIPTTAEIFVFKNKTSFMRHGAMNMIVHLFGRFRPSRARLSLAVELLLTQSYSLFLDLSYG